MVELRVLSGFMENRDAGEVGVVAPGRPTGTQDLAPRCAREPLFATPARPNSGVCHACLPTCFTGLAGDQFVSGEGINIHGHVVGSSDHLGGYIYRGRKMEALNALIDPKSAAVCGAPGPDPSASPERAAGRGG
jgi:hypothetical protein